MYVDINSYLASVKAKTRNIDSPLAPSELVLNSEGAVYHLGLKPHQIADKIIVVGDPNRVRRISAHFDHVEYEVAFREFFTHTGTIGGKRITALSTGIGIDNIDIVMNELDALRNLNLETRLPNEKENPLSIVRIGTSGALNQDIEVGAFVHSKYAIGLDGLLHYYLPQYEEDESALVEAYMQHTQWNKAGIKPYAVRGSEFMDEAFSKFAIPGITMTANGFYGPQGRQLRLQHSSGDLNQQMSQFNFRGTPIANYEMESSALLGLGGMLGHRCTTVCAVIANRLRNEFLSDYKPTIDRLIQHVLDALLAD